MLFEIRALGREGRVRLRLEAADSSDAAQQARLQGLTVLDVRTEARLVAWPLGRHGCFPLSLFSRELLALLNSGLALVEALQTLEEKETRPETRKVLTDVLRHLYEGESFSAAIAHQPLMFPALYIATVRASERTGDLAQALGRYVAYQDQVVQVRKKALSAFIYPLLLMGLGGLVALFLLGYVTPRFSSIYADNVDRLPWASRMLMEWGGFAEAHAAEAGLLLLGLASAFLYGATRPGTRAWLGRVAWSLPALGERLRIFQLTRFYRTVGMLLSGGIPVVTALEMASGLLHPELRSRLGADPGGQVHLPGHGACRTHHPGGPAHAAGGREKWTHGGHDGSHCHISRRGDQPLRGLVHPSVRAPADGGDRLDHRPDRGAVVSAHLRTGWEPGMRLTAELVQQAREKARSQGGTLLAALEGLCGVSGAEFLDELGRAFAYPTLGMDPTASPMWYATCAVFIATP